MFRLDSDTTPEAWVSEESRCPEDPRCTLHKTKSASPRIIISLPAQMFCTSAWQCLLFCCCKGHVTIFNTTSQNFTWSGWAELIGQASCTAHHACDAHTPGWFTGWWKVNFKVKQKPNICWVGFLVSCWAQYNSCRFIAQNSNLTLSLIWSLCSAHTFCTHVHERRTCVWSALIVLPEAFKSATIMALRQSWNPLLSCFCPEPSAPEVWRRSHDNGANPSWRNRWEIEEGRNSWDWPEPWSERVSGFKAWNNVKMPHLNQRRQPWTIFNNLRFKFSKNQVLFVFQAREATTVDQGHAYRYCDILRS